MRADRRARHAAGGHRRGRVIENAIIDKNARIGRGVRILNEAGVKERDGDGYYIREGIVIVPKNGVHLIPRREGAPARSAGVWLVFFSSRIRAPARDRLG